MKLPPASQPTLESVLDGTCACMLRFANIRAMKIVESWPQLGRLVEHEAFPPGRYLSPNVRAWTPTEIREWLLSRPSERPPAWNFLTGAEKERRRSSAQPTGRPPGRPRKHPVETAERA